MGILDNKVAIVTGGGRGMGSTIARKLASEGAKVVVHYGHSAETAEEIAAQTGGIALQADLTSAEQSASLVDTVIAKWGKIDILVNTAASFANGTSFETDSWESYMEEMNGVFGATFHITRAVVPRMIAAGYGRIVNFGATMLFRPTPGYGPHMAAKAAVVGLTRTLVRELGPHGITVNIIHPGMTMTEFTKSMPEAERNKVANQTPLRRLAEPDDIAGAALFFASEYASFVSNAELSVDGGLATG